MCNFGLRSRVFEPPFRHCPACKASEAWKAEDELLTNPMSYRVPVVEQSPAVVEANTASVANKSLELVPTAGEGV